MLSPCFLRLALVVSGTVFCSLTEGFIIGQMSGMIEDMLSGDTLSQEHVSWISATINMTCIFGFIVSMTIADVCGRPKTVTILTAPIICTWVMLYYGESFTIFMITRVLVGTCFGGLICLSIIITAEYTAPNMRGLCLNLVTAGGTSVGTMLGHILSLFFHWRTVALFGIIPTAIAAIIPIFWYESPTWLASKGRFKECEESFKALHGDRLNAEKELQLVLEVEKSKFSKRKTCRVEIFSLQRLKSLMQQRFYWKVILLGCVISTYRVFASKTLFATFAITMLREITQSKDIFLFTLLVDGFAVFGSFLSIFFISKMKSRTLLFSTCIVANVLLIVLSATLYYKDINNVYMNWVNCTLLALYFITVNAGTYPVLDATYGELAPMEMKGDYTILVGGFASIAFFLHIKFAPLMFAAMDYHGTFPLNVVVMTVGLVYLWFYLPETKGRSLQEIELLFKTNSSDKPSEMYSDQAEDLI